MSLNIPDVYKTQVEKEFEADYEHEKEELIQE
jgi:hypothetical protein